MDTLEPQEELEQLQQALSSRQSTTLFTHAALALVVALIVSGAAAKLFWDSAKLPYAGIAAAVVALGLAAFSVSRYLRGKRLLKTELERFERLMGLRRSLGLDDPAALLPSA